MAQSIKADGPGEELETLSRHHLRLESVEIGYSDIFLEYSIYLTTVTRSICLEYSDIYLEYHDVNPFPIPGHLPFIFPFRTS